MQRLQWGGVLFIIWLGLTNSFHYQELLAGLLLSGAIVWLTIPSQSANRESQLWQPLALLTYLPVFFKNLMLANIDVAGRVLNPKLPINPGIVKVNTSLTAPYQRLILANSITLTPGTVTLETEDQAMYIHWIDVQTTNVEHAGNTIKGEIEAAIERI